VFTYSSRFSWFGSNLEAMKAMLKSLLVAFAILTFATVAQAQSPKWEYLAVNAGLNNRNLEQMLDARGAEGWELVAFTRKDVAVFKRKAR
jgi:hypothetical protein